MVDCRESRDLMSGAVDDQLQSGESRHFNDHIEICGRCRDEYDLEKLTKAYIKRKITYVDVPYDLEQTIMAQLLADAPFKATPRLSCQADEQQHLSARLSCRRHLCCSNRTMFSRTNPI